MDDGALLNSHQCNGICLNNEFFEEICMYLDNSFGSLFD